MATQVLARALEPLVTTKEVGAGTGLGLASAVGTVNHPGGQLQLRGEPGSGTEVLIRLRVADGS